MLGGRWLAQKGAVKRDELRWGRSLIIAAAMMGLVLVVSIVMIHHINQTERERCFDHLYREASDLAAYIEGQMAADREALELLAAVVARSEDLAAPALWQTISSFEQVGLMSDISLLLPDDTMIHGNGSRVDVAGQLSFAHEAAFGAHLSERAPSVLNPKDYVLRHFVPVVRDGQTVALLYGMISLTNLPQQLNLSPYGGRGALYIVEGGSGNFLLDTWHSKLGNLWQLGQRQIASGYDRAKFEQDLRVGNTDYFVVKSHTSGDFLYIHYRPLALNDWRLGISVPRTVVFESSLYIERVLNIFLLIEMVCFALYLIWLLWDVRRVTAEKQRRLETIQHIHEIEQFLFNAHERKENLYAAIERMGDILSAERINFWMLDSGVNHNYRWTHDQQAVECDDSAPLPPVKLLQNFAQGADLYETYDPEEIAAVWPDAAVNSLIVVPVRNVIEGQLSGILALSNVTPDALNIPLLKALSFSFGMFCHNVKNRNDLQEQGDRDRLTGMYNRNRYERDLPELFAQHQGGLTCIYIDVNGLRELNNTKGHDLGDVMLRTVAHSINSYFPGPYQYRVGGDEFVLFVPGTDEYKLMRCSQELSAHLLEYDYHISVGIEAESSVQSIAHLIKAAEHKMYAQKREFYRDRRREMHVA